MYHTSPTEIKEINNLGIAGDCLFFSDDVYTMTAGSDFVVYEADFDCIEAFRLEDAEICEEIADRFEVDLDTAQSILDGSDSEWNYGADADDSWWLQGKRGECAVKMGYDGCEDEDEQGVVYIVPMSGRESELRIVNH